MADGLSNCDYFKAGWGFRDGQVWRGAVGKALNRVTRWQPTLLHDQFLEGWAGVIPPGYSETGDPGDEASAA
jgi:hypothetical protein